MKFAPLPALLLSVLCALPIPYFAYWSWDFAARSGAVVVYELCRYSHCMPYALRDHGIFGFIIDGLLCGALLYFSGIWAWRGLSRYPCAIIMPDRLWLHPTFGARPIPLEDVGDVTLEEGPERWRSLSLVIYLVDPPRRNWMAKLFFWKSVRTEIRIRPDSVSGALDHLEDFRSALLARI